MTKRKETKRMGLEDILSRKGSGGNIEEFEGEVIEILGAEFTKGQFTDDNGNPRPYVKLNIIKPDGEPWEISTGAGAVVSKIKDLADGDHLPVKVRVTSYPGQFGKKGYDIRPPEEPVEE